MRSRLLLAFLTLSASAAVSAQQLTPRDAFWSASDLVGGVSANPAAAKKPAKAAGESTHHTAKPAPQNAPAHVNPELVSENGYGAQPHLVQASMRQQPQLGLRYTLLSRNASGQYEEVGANAIFHTGDHVRLSLMSNEPGYLYVITQGSSGAWTSIFPGPGAAADENHIEQGRVYEIPGKQSFAVTGQAGPENMFVILSRQPIHDLDSTIEGLKNPGAQATDAKRPAPSGQLLEASNRIPDELVQRLTGRDLTLVDEQQVNQPATSTNSGEKAVYVVAKYSAASGSANQVVARLTLRHE